MNVVIYPFIIFLLLFVSCSKTTKLKKWYVQDFKVTDNIHEWKKATPESQGVHSESLVQMMEQIQRDTVEVDAIVIIRNGYLIYEAYNKPYTSEILHKTYSGTKSVTSTLVGLAIADGQIEGPEQAIVDLLPSKAKELKKALNPNLKLKHFLTMTSGLKKNSLNVNISVDWTSFILLPKQFHEPGTHFSYSSESTYILGALLKENIGKNLDTYAKEKLFKPLGIRQYRWSLSPDGTAKGEGGLWLTPQDFARFAWMIAQNGVWNGQQIVPSEWVQQSTTPYVSDPRTDRRYGYQWWIETDGTINAHGSNGQYAFIVPEKNLVVVMMCSVENEKDPYIKQLYYQYIVPSLSAEAKTENPEMHKLLETKASSWEHRLASSNPVPEKLVPLLNKKYKLEDNRNKILTIESKYENGVLHYIEEYENSKRRYEVGIGKYLTTKNGDFPSASTAFFSGSDNFQIRTISLGQAANTDINVTFDGNDATIVTRFASGQSITLKAKIDTQVN